VSDEAKFSIYNYTPPGAVAGRFINSTGPIDLIRGPWGSGKTVACVFKIARHAAVDFPVCKDGTVRVRAAAIRDTYREMAKTALSSWHEFFPKNGPFTRQPVRDHYTGGSDRPVKHGLGWDVLREWPVRNGPAGSMGWEKRKTPVLLDMEFGAIGEQNIESFFKGYEISLGWMNECDLLNPDVPGKFYGRTGRYPPQGDICEWEAARLGTISDPELGREVIRVPRIILGDFNPPDESNWTYEREIENGEEWKERGYNFFAQPSGLSSDAENRIGKKRYQYEEEERAFGGPKAPDAIRNVHGQYAAKRDGTPVYADKFALDRHRADEPLKPVPELPIYLGLDAGGTPACGIGQFLPNGQFRGLAEITTSAASVTGPERFGAMILARLMADYPGMAIGGAWGDPSAWYGADKEHGQLAFMETVSQILGYPIRPTHTNDVSSRIEAVALSLKDIDPRTPGSLYDPRLKITLRGFVSQYKLTKNASENKTTYLEIAKNEFSHIHDAWQYLHLGFRGGALVRKSVESVRGVNVVPINRGSHRQPQPSRRSIWDV
jgi:hypothetical protein